MRTLNRVRDVVLAITIAVASLSASACSDETGIIIEVTRTDGFTTPVSKLSFFVGESIIRADGHFADQQQLEDQNVAGRDLIASPFRLFVRPPSGAEPDDRIAVGVMALGEQGQPVGFGYLPTPIAFVPGSVTQWRVELHGVNEPDFVDTVSGCFAWTDGNSSTFIGAGNDLDCDGFGEDAGDCNDLNPGQFPTNTELCDNQIDDDCDPTTNEDELQDRAEICNGIDDNCDGKCDDGFDPDGDSYTECGSVLGSEDGACLDYDPLVFDCEPGIGEIYPGAQEMPDGIDNNCSGACDDDPALDGDADGFTLFGRFGVCSPAGNIADCKPTKEQFYPGSHEFCDGLDGDCRDGEGDRTTCFVPVAGRCLQGARECSETGDLGLCQPSPGVSVNNVGLPTQVCGYYLGCEDDMMDPYTDPYECALNGAELVATDFETCYTTSTATGLCPSSPGIPGGVASVEIPALVGGDQLTAPCTIQIIGPPVQQGFKVSLAADPANDVTFHNECGGATLAVTPTEASSTASIIITRNDSLGHFQVVQVTLINTVVDDCGTAMGLTCTSWNADPFPAL